MGWTSHTMKIYFFTFINLLLTRLDAFSFWRTSKHLRKCKSHYYIIWHSHWTHTMSDKFSLKWNDFQTTVSSSFKTFRQEEDFCDVTLVSDDEVQMSAHKLILSACSSFFKSILKKNPHSSPLLYLSGVDSILGTSWTTFTKGKFNYSKIT